MIDKEKAKLNIIEIDIDSFIEKFYSHQNQHLFLT